MEKYRYIIEFSDGSIRTLNVKKTSKFKLKFKRESEEEYVRIFPSGEVRITDKEDYNWLMNYENDITKRCGTFLFHLDLFCSGEYKRYQTFKFSLNNCKPCLDTCEIAIDLVINDVYQCIKDGDKERNVLETGDLVEKTVDSYPDFNNLEFYITLTDAGGCSGTGDTPPTNASSWGYFGCSNTSVGSGGTGCASLWAKIWARKKVKRSCVSGSPLALPTGGVLLNNSCSIDGTYTYAQPYAGATNLYTFTPPAGGGEFGMSSALPCETDTVITDPYVFLNQSTKSTMCQNPPYPDFPATVTICFYVDLKKLELVTPKKVYDRGRDALDTLLWLANQSCKGVTKIESLFMDKNVYGAGVVNYVTSRLNKLKDLVLLEKSDGVTPLSSEKATILNLTFKEFYTDLKKMFHIRMIINNGVLVLEHISKLKTDKNIVLTLTKELDGFCCYEYDVTNIPKYEEWKMQEANGMDFIGFPIEYNNSLGDLNPCVTSDEVSVDLSNVMTDLYYVQNSGTTNLSLSGFMLLANEDDGIGGRKVASEIGELTGSMILNGHLSIANLQKNYHCHNRHLGVGWMNKVFMPFCSETKKKIGQDVEIKFCCKDLLSFDPNGLVNTKFGNGDIMEGEYDLEEQRLTLNLIY